MSKKIEVWARCSQEVFDMLRDQGVSGPIMVNRKPGSQRVFQVNIPEAVANA
jgi:hypothetical protein